MAHNEINLFGFQSIHEEQLILKGLWECMLTIFLKGKVKGHGHSDLYFKIGLKNSLSQTLQTWYIDCMCVYVQQMTTVDFEIEV